MKRHLSAGRKNAWPQLTLHLLLKIMKPQKQEHISTRSTSLTFGLNFAPRRAALVSITGRHAISPCHRSVQPSRRLDVKLNLQVMVLLRKMQTAPSPLAKRAEDRAAPFPHVNQLPLSRRLAAISNTLPLSLAPIAIICTTSMRLPRIR